MIRILKPTMRIGVAALALATVGGCALLSTPDPVRTYRFGQGVDAGAVGATGRAATNAALAQIALRRISFPGAAGGDRMLGVTGTEAAYIGGARWVDSAEDLFTASLENAFADSGRVRVIGRREVTPSASSLDIDVRAFEASYAAAGAAPVVRISARARLLDLSSRTVTAEQTFMVEQPTSQNRVTAIVEAYDQATRDITGQIVAWTEANAPVPSPEAKAEPRSPRG